MQLHELLKILPFKNSSYKLRRGRFVIQTCAHYGLSVKIRQYMKPSLGKAKETKKGSISAPLQIYRIRMSPLDKHRHNYMNVTVRADGAKDARA